jgi:hypothetical protein
MLSELYLHLVGCLFSWVTEVVCISEFANYAGRSIAAVGAICHGPVLSDVPGKDVYPGLPGWGWMCC